MRAIYAVGGAAVVAVLGIFGGSAAWSSSDPENLVSAMVAAASAPEEAARTAEVTPLTVLLLGDSYTAGNGARDESGRPVYYGPERCMRSTGTWGEQYARTMAQEGYAVTLLNRACSAATTGAIIADRSMRDTRVVSYPEPELADVPRTDAFYQEWAAAEARCIPSPGTEEYFAFAVNRAPQPDGSMRVSVACERWLPAQTDALNRDVDLVLMTAGGNDVHFPNIARECLILANPGTCEAAIDEAHSYVREQFADDLLSVFEHIEEKSEGQSKVAYAAYPGLEVSDDLRITSVGLTGVASYPVAEHLAALSREGLEAQREAVAQANARFGDGFVTLMEGVPELFSGHEPDARPSVANPDRWMYEFLETTERDEWYHLKPEGHRALADYAATYGDFGAADDSPPARDVAIVFDQTPGARAAVESALRDSALWLGSRIHVVEERVADDGVKHERRVLAQSSAPAEALAAMKHSSAEAWRAAGSVRIPSRWNAAAQMVHVGDVAMESQAVDAWWTDGGQGLVPSVHAQRVDASQPPDVVSARVKEALATAAQAPHAWAGGVYVAAGERLHLNAQGSYALGSRGGGRLDYAWDLDGDGFFEVETPEARLTVDTGVVEPGWVSVRVTTDSGETSVASAWVAMPPPPVSASTPCVTSDAGAVGQSQSGRRGCRPETGLMAGPASQAVPNAKEPSLRVVGGAARGEALGDGAVEAGDHPLVALTMLSVSMDERVTASYGARARRGSRVNDQGRGRPSELVRRERALRALTSDFGALR
ncbi:hypothetical protein LGT39_07935 [Demequina sp. TTPB684]|uniref:SGNH/GDSL hydrolase family protein n=1 Tax=Demequina sp. TTPB684 TaxID=2881057 RepID=UPI001CF54157|nr:SGNH/GDSL hydrolase family protein [Demequina sp. TTPB684]MCB2412773.1 hypothetical protein [Demequina sp. TTPB684]